MQGFNISKKTGAEAFPEKQATPEQQASFDKFLAASRSLLFDDSFLEKGANIMSQAATTVDGMARIGASIASRIYMQAAKEGEIIETIVLVEAGRVFMNDIADFAKALNHEVSEDDIDDAYLMAADMVRKTLDDSGLLDREMMEKEAAQAREIFTEEDFNPIRERMAKSRQAVSDNMIPGGA